MKGKLEQPDLGISNKEYWELVSNNKRVTRGSVTSFISPNISNQNPFSLDRKHSNSSNRSKGKSSKEYNNSNRKEKSRKHSSEDPEPLSLGSHRKSSQISEKVSTPSNSAQKQPKQYQKAPPPKQFKYQEVNLELVRPIKLFQFEQIGPQIRNEYPLGLNLLKHRHVKVIQKEVCENKEKIKSHNAFISKRNKNDYTHINVEYFDDKLNHSHGLSTTLYLANPKDRSFMLTQEIGVIELDQNQFENLFNRVEPVEVNFNTMKTKNKVVYWPAVVLNNCAVDLKTLEFLTYEIEDDCDFLKDYIMEPTILEHVMKMEHHDRLVIKKEVSSLFEEEHENHDENLRRVQEEMREIFGGEDENEGSDLNNFMEEEKQPENEHNKKNQIDTPKILKENRNSDDTDNIFGSEGKDENGSLGSLEEAFQKEKAQEKRLYEELIAEDRKEESIGLHKANEIKREEDMHFEYVEDDTNMVFSELPLQKKVKTEDDHLFFQREKLEDEFYHQVHQNVAEKELKHEGTVLIWLVGTGYFQIKKIQDIKPLNTEIKTHLTSLGKKSKFLNRMLVHFGKLTKNYNNSTQDSDYSLPVSNKIMKDNLFKVVYLGNEDRVLSPMVPLTIKEKKNEIFTILRVLDDYSLFIVKNNDSKTVVKISSFLPPLEPAIIERLDNVTLLQSFNKDIFVKKVLFPSIYPSNLIDSNFFSFGVPHQRIAINKNFLPEDPSITRNIRCKQCNYILGDLSYHKCHKCDEYSHDHCITAKKPNSLADPLRPLTKNDKKNSNKWVCNSCKSCSYCTSSTNKEYMVFCANCEEAYHSFCFQALHPSYRIHGDNRPLKFICTECALCQMCGYEINNFSDKNIMDDLTLCDDCIEVRLRKEYCPICNKRWDNVQSHLTKEEIEMIECQCQMWVHKYCDSELSKEVFKEFSLTGRAYHCPNCRRNLKNKQLADFISILIDLDEHKYFAFPVDELAAPNYRQVISYPMDFSTMEKKSLSSQYSSDPFNLLKADFDLICHNAIIYNMPKSPIFIMAKKMKKFGEKAFQYFKELIECSDKEFLKFSKKLTPNHFAAQFKKEIDEYYVDILFEEKGMNPLTRIRVIDNTKTNPFQNNNSVSIAINTRKNQNKDVFIEITGLNYLLSEKSIREERRNTETRTKTDHVHQKGNKQLTEDSDSMTIESEVKRKDSLIGYEEENKNPMYVNKFIMREGVALIKDLLSMTAKSKPFFYFYPVVIQFTNPDLIKYDVCYLCGSFGDNEDFMFCNTCQEGYHYYCISKSYIDENKFQRLKSNPCWNCPKCKLCQFCNKKSESHDCLVCETCDNLYHLNCIYPQVGVLFTSEWRCEECFKCSRCGSNKLFSENLNIENGTIQPEFCENFKWCYECGLKLAYFKFCKICKKFCQKTICPSNVKNETRSLQYISPIEDSIECKACRFKYHISCYEEEFSTLENYEDFLCENCKVDNTEIDKMESELEKKAEEIITKRRLVKLLMRICESIYNQYISIHNTKHDHIKDNLSRHLFDYIAEDFAFLSQQTHIKTTLENYKLLNTATKLMGSKFQSQTAITNTTSSRHETSAPISELNWEHIDTDFLNEYFDLFDFLREFPIMCLEELELFHDLSCIIAMKEKETEVLPTETSREYYDYKGFMKFRDEQLGFWMLLPLDIIYDENFILINHSFLTDLNLLSSVCLRQEAKMHYEDILNKQTPYVNAKLSQLFVFSHLLETNDPYYFEPLSLNRNDKPEANEKFADIIDFTTETVWAPYWKTTENIRFSLFQDSIVHKRERPGVLVPVKEMEHDKFAKLFYREPLKTPVKLIGEIDISHSQGFNINDASTSSGKRAVNNEEGKCYEELKNLMFAEMIAVEVIKRRLKFWLDHRKDTANHNHYHIKTKQLSSTRHLGKDRNHHNSMQIEDQHHISYRKASIHHEQANSSKMELEETEAQSNKAVSIQNKMTEELPDITEQDLLLRSPMANIECVCCKTPGDRKLSGRLLFVDCDQWVHTNCALWSYDVFENIEGGLVNFFNSYRLSLTTICAFCQKSGATIACFSKKCQRKYHFKCAMSAKCTFLTNKRFYCKICSNSKTLDNKVNTDFTTLRRLYIVRNQNPFTEYANSSLYFKEKPLDLQSGTFNRIGNLTVISAKKYNSELKFLLQEYAITKILTQEEGRRPIFITISFQDNKYFYKFNKIDDSILLNKKTLYAQKTAHEGEETWKALETAETFFESLSTFIHQTTAMNPPQTSSKDKLTRRELLGEFLALTNFDVRKWLKSSVNLDEDDGTEKKEYPSFKEYYYSQNIDKLDPFSRQEKVDEIYARIVPKIQNVIQNSYYKDQGDRLKNPREKSFNKLTKNIKSNKRKADSLGHFEFGTEDIESHHYGALLENTKCSQIQSTELEIKLKGDYWTHKKKPSKILVAPSNIHRYGLFALENFNKNEIVIEYCGEIIRNKVADLRENQYKREGFGDCFMFRADKDSVIDASFKGNQARYLNHSCNPNCSSIIIEVDDEPKIIMYANRPIYPGEELTYDYQFDIEAEKIECTCGAKNCQGRLN